MSLAVLYVIVEPINIANGFYRFKTEILVHIELRLRLCSTVVNIN